MTRVRWAVASRKRRKKFLKMAKGQYAGRSKLYRMARNSVQKGMYYSFRDRKAKKRTFRSLWITRINTACREFGISYSRFIDGLKKAKIALNRQVLADMAVNDKKAFGAIIKAIKG